MTVRIYAIFGAWIYRFPPLFSPRTLLEGPRCHRGLRLHLRRGGKFSLVSAHDGNSGCPAISPWGRTWAEGWGITAKCGHCPGKGKGEKREHGQLTSASSTRRPVKATTAAPSREIPVASSAMVSISSSIPAVSVSVSVAAVTPPVSARVHCPGLGGILCLCLLDQWIPGLIEILMPENGARECWEFCSCLELLGWSWVHSLKSRTPVASRYRLVRAWRMSQWTRSRALPGWSVSSPLVRAPQQSVHLPDLHKPKSRHPTASGPGIQGPGI